MLIVIGIVLIVYGCFSFKYSDRWVTNANKQKSGTRFPEWFPLLIRIGAILFMIIGILLIVTYVLVL
ncbi:hypothetical protein [Alkalibacterium kapii]|uniref:Uncharacterized protein n=1 Tax=Alkalibacterium kapii TaxID=426704 RepID=A0A511AUS8_9LACT|nr:hypothetical protein [Alkalibacterium kapii]GEK91958.1 hypothetical protein AKA01nite_15800 [Alkalibacterium kapii]